MFKIIIFNNAKVIQFIVYCNFLIEINQGFAERLRPMVKETISYLHKTLADHNKNVLVECANAVMLDIDFGKLISVSGSWRYTISR